MKTKLLLLITIIALFGSCNDSIYGLRNKQYCFYIFRYADTEMMQGVDNKDVIITTGDNKIITGYKRHRNEPYFGRKFSFNLCELATEEKLLALHDGWFAYFPYTALQFDGCTALARAGKWEDVCNVDYAELPILGGANGLYAEVRRFDADQLELITLKNRNKMTIEDIEKAINTLIDQNRVRNHCQQVDGVMYSPN